MSAWYRAAREARVDELVDALREHARAGRKDSAPQPDTRDDVEKDYSDAKYSEQDWWID